MKIDNTSNSMLFKHTEIPDIFFTEYFDEAPSDAIKVYMYILFYSKYSNDLSLKSISAATSMNMSVVKDALNYWEEKGLIIRTTMGYNLISVQEKELLKAYNPKVTYNVEDLKNKEDNKKRDEIIETINNKFFQGLMSPAWYNDISLWFKKYNFSYNVMLMLFQYCYSREALHKNYVVTVANAWYKNGIREYQDVLKMTEVNDKITKIGKEISKNLRLNRNLTVFEEEFVKKWVTDYNFDKDIINYALKMTVGKNSPSFSYIDTIITDWYNKELKSVKDIEIYSEEFLNKNKMNVNINNKNIYNKNKINVSSNHEQRDFDLGNIKELYD